MTKVKCQLFVNVTSVLGEEEDLCIGKIDDRGRSRVLENCV